MAMIAMTTSSSIRVKPTRCQRSNKAFRFEVVITAQLVEFGFVQKLNAQIRTSIKDCPKNNRNQPAENCAFDRTPELTRDEAAPARPVELQGALDTDRSLVTVLPLPLGGGEGRGEGKVNMNGGARLRRALISNG